MRELTDHEKRTIRLGTMALAAGLGLAAVLWCGKKLQARRDDYHKLMVEAQDLRDQMDLSRDKAQAAQKLMDNFHLDPMKLSRSNLVAEASAAIQKASGDSGVGMTSLRETPAHGAGKEIASIQFEGAGPVPAIMTLLYKLERAGSPLIIDSVRITADSRRPGGSKVNLTIVVLDFDQWKEGQPNA